MFHCVKHCEYVLVTVIKFLEGLFIDIFAMKKISMAQSKALR